MIAWLCRAGCKGVDIDVGVLATVGDKEGVYVGIGLSIAGADVWLGFGLGCVGDVAVSGIPEGKTSRGFVDTAEVSTVGIAEGFVALGVQAEPANMSVRMIAINRFTI